MGIREEKVSIVSEIAEKLQASKSTIITDYRGLTVGEVTELRARLRDAGIEFRVLKNTMTRRAADQVNMSEVNEFLVGPSAIAFSTADDVVAPAKILNEFAKTHKALELKAGIVDGKVIGQAEVQALAELPSREGLLSMLLSVLQAPMRNFAYAVQQIADKQEA
ncbi:50S ribosomal protein L10 [Tumebacillus permanentifrigoris]|uniref:Large ribosomal subunit protein uL10 n=1 Tax=Tumebacillus permanentifrigoris TaxID=378543 RepID=A0A316D5J8_9BACL|nr:50S ribosomal protein L10 [Tumebacillus permanentifrigoris]PWK05664.1 LSU ribosomal protein L10P [Tumebacillus permanentifrigoris]